MDADTFEISVEIVNELGLHARAATKLVQLAGKYPCQVFVEKDGQEANGKSIMGVLMLVASKGSVITIRTRGPQACEAGEALAELVSERFGEDK
ncbi:HPr family phosphocarrier protein [Haliangium ochraceum]|uniref:Phosphotransferase system, phosphocarrier protein HPr n=1 Tax=Haliangium ochraceum (strain DSM 14365 / JCM 11303 / SMP-2) TaxID=502025 RepID=D0LNB1_HALO1|nr:HPr family phosphocarrier protein [Haliangium ochraceum]ACY15288.1 Phosphotransferase system, phosphocarrier protein HPr [Haliangium ochraceum DSM 14365]